MAGIAADGTKLDYSTASLDNGKGQSRRIRFAFSNDIGWGCRLDSWHGLGFILKPNRPSYPLSD
jgi:hypothetical protein